MRTGPDFREDHTLNDGTRIVLRHIHPDDAGELRAAFDRLSPASRYRRFFAGMPSLSPAALRYLTEVDGRDHVAILATASSPDLKSELVLGVGRFIRLQEDPTVAEAAVTVVDDTQRKGLGRILALTLAEAACERGIRTFRVDVLSDNEPMRTILDEAGAVVRARDGGIITYDIALESFVPTPGGFIDRLFHAAEDSVAILWRRLVPPQS